MRLHIRRRKDIKEREKKREEEGEKLQTLTEKEE